MVNLIGHNFLKRQQHELPEKPCRGFDNEKTLTVPLRNVSKLLCREDHLLNKPPDSMLLE